MSEQNPWPTPEHRSEPDDDALIVVGVAWAEDNHTTIPDSTARRIALQWHSGRDSPLYALGSTGAIEVNEVLAELDGHSQPLDMDDPKDLRSLISLQHLQTYATTTGDRDPVDRWDDLTRNGNPPIFFIEQLRPEQYIGTYTNRHELAEQLLVATGVFKALEVLKSQYGGAVTKYFHVDVPRYARDLVADVRMTDNEDGTIDAYWRL